MSISQINSIINEKVYEKTLTELPSVETKEKYLCDISKIVLKKRKDLPPFYRYVPADAYNILSLLNEDMYLISADKMNDDYEGFVKAAQRYHLDFDNKLKRFQQKTLLKSFSEYKDSLDMWEDYADQHRGMCITYCFKNLCPKKLNHFYPVHYTNDYFSCIHPSELENNPYFYLRKTRKWEKEGEWRFVYLDSRQRSVSLKNCITEVCFGLRMDKNFRDRIIRAAKKIYPNNKITFNQATLIRDELQVQELK